MALARAIQGAKRPSQTIKWTREDGTPEDLTGATITARIQRQGQGSPEDVTGTFTVTDGDGGESRWDYSDDDVEMAGTHRVQFTAMFNDTPTPAKTFITEWIVEESL